MRAGYRPFHARLRLRTPHLSTTNNCDEEATMTDQVGAPKVVRRERYNPQEIEPKWMRRWEESGLYRTDLTLSDGRPKFYNLMEFPYPSAEGLHIGHAFTYGGADTS